MIISVHIPKTAGTSFRISLAQAIGSRLHLDYGDWLELRTTEVQAHNARRREQALAKARDLETAHDIIHGHFSATKYDGVFAQIHLVTFLRDPVQQTISAFYEAQRSKRAPHPAIAMVHEAGMGLAEFAEAFPNHQSLYLAGLDIQAFDMVGITEDYPRSVAMFRDRFRVDVSGNGRENVNPAAQGGYQIDQSMRRAIERTREIDIELYRRACERFADEIRKYER